MKIFIFNQKQLRLWSLTLIGLLVVTGFLLNCDRLTRQMFGVKSGVSLEGRNVTGMLPAELTRLVNALADNVNREPQDAGYFSETGEIIPARPGKMVDVAETVQHVCTAKAGTRLKLTTVTVAPKIGETFFKPIYHGDLSQPKVALAINVAWGEEYLPAMLEILKTAHVKATFFFVGSWVKAFPEKVREIAGAGHEIANHGLYHGHPLQMNTEELRRLITANTELLRQTIGREPSKLFGPPYGEVNAQIAGTAGEIGYRTIMWSVDTIDWKNPAPEALLHRVLSKIGPGGIILMHPTKSTRMALERLLQGLKKRNLQAVSVSELLDTKPGKAQ